MNPAQRRGAKFPLAVLFLLTSAAAAHAADARSSMALPPDGGRIVIETPAAREPAPVFFSATADQTVQVSQTEITSEIRLSLRAVNGRPELLTLGLSGDGDVVEATGERLRAWAVRHGTGADAGKRFLDLHVFLPVPARGKESEPAERTFDVRVRTRLQKPPVPGTSAVLLLTPDDAVGFAAKVSLAPDPSVDLRVTVASGMTPLHDAREPQAAPRFFTTGDARLEVKLARRGAAAANAELLGMQLVGRVDEATRSVEFRLRGELRAAQAGARLRLLAGAAALSDRAMGEGWHVELAADPDLEDELAYFLVSDRAGTMPVELRFVAALRESGDWRDLDFTMPGGAVVPLSLEGLDDSVSFRTDADVVPILAASATGGNGGHVWRGFLPANGAASLAWKHARAAADGALFFTSFEQTDVRVGAGVLRQSSQLAFRILQGKLAVVRCQLDGPGEILGVDGANVVGWRLLPAEAGRVLEIRFSRPVEAESALTIHSQTELGTWPARAEPLRLKPEGGVRHSGFVRVANRGAVRLEVVDVAGMMQLAPGQFPGPALEPKASGAGGPQDGRQVFVYRFPSANYAYRIVATQIQAEVNVSVIATHELTDMARVLNASIELDVREAPLRDWTLRVPEDYVVVAVSGSDVADHVTESEASDGSRALRVLFGRAIEGRQLLNVRLEKNQPAGAGEWRLPALRFPGAKTVRGHIGAVSAPGYRLVVAGTERLVDVPLSFFPRQTPGLQQAWRVREPDWTAAVRIEALGQSVQADVFHLYSVKEGVVHGSVLINYFVVGAPATEWRVEVPAALGNIDVVGQNVRRDWRREGEQLVITLHQPVLGAATLLVTFEQPMSARGGAILPGQVQPLGVQAERGYLQVVSPLQVKHEIRRAEGGLLKLEPGELPAEFRLLTASPSLALYQYTARPFALELGIEWFAPGETVDQVVDFAKLSSQVSRDGQVVTEGQFFVKTRGRKALRVILPREMKLWEARVDGELVNARADGGQTIVPLPARSNPNEPVAVVLRGGQAAEDSGRVVRLVAPQVVSAATIVSDWIVRSDAGRLLVSRGGNAELVQPSLTETGFEWIAGRGLGRTALLLAAVAFGFLLMRSGGWRVAAGLAVCLLATFGGAALAVQAALERRVNLRELTYAVTMVPAGETVAVEVANLPDWRAMLVGWGLAIALAGLGLLVASRKEPLPRRAMLVVGAVLVAAGLLAQRGGAVVFFAVVSATVFFGIYVPHILHWRQQRRQRDLSEAPPLGEPGAGSAPVVSLLVIAGILTLTLGMTPTIRAERVAQPAAASDVGGVAEPSHWLGAKPAQAMNQTWEIRGDRLFADVELTVRGVVGDSFLLLRPPAVLTEFKGDGLRVTKIERENETAYYVTPERAGVLTARVRYEMAVKDRAKGIVLPTGPAATQRVAVQLDQPGWDFASEAAVQVLPMADLGDVRSGATLVLAPAVRTVVVLQPKRRDVGAEPTQFFAEAANLYVPGPGVVNAFTRFTVRPVQGRVSTVDIDVPSGFTVGDVTGPVGTWRFDPEKRRLQIAVEPAQTEPFKLLVEAQHGAGELPFALALEPMRMLGAAGEVGMVALAFGHEVQPEGVRVVELSAVNVQDFDASLVPRTRDGHPLAALQHAWRYGAKAGRVELKVAPVAPEVRVASRQVVSLDDDRLVMAVDLRVAITRVGLFKLSFALPEGLELEAASGAALAQWTEALEAGRRLITLHLNGRTVGEQTFNLTLVGAAPRGSDGWAFPRLLVREATRHTGEVVIVPGKGIRLRAIERERVTQLDPRTLGGMQPGALAFRLLQEDWVLRLGIENLEPWVTVQALQEVTVREGQTLTRVAVKYRVENAATKTTRVRLPGLTEAAARTVRATGAAVSDMVRVDDGGELWEIRFQRGIAGETDVQIEFQAAGASEGGTQAVVAPEFLGARQVAQFVAVRSGGRLELEASALPRGWTRVDWSAVPAALQHRGDRSAPVLSLRVAEPEGPLVVTVRRHEVAEALKLRVTQGELTTLFAPGGAYVTAVELKIEVLEKGTLRVRLPEGARLFNTFVNGQSVAVVREADAWLFHVAPQSAGERSAQVKLVYSAIESPGGDVELTGPRLNVPLENAAWRVVLPPGYALEDYDGELRLRGERFGAAFDLDDYQALVSSKRSAEAQQSFSLLQQANSLLQQGQQEKAAEALSRVSNANVLDEASNEDARVQLRNLKTQQAVLSLNTRRQKLYFDNRADAARNEQLEQAASVNPFLQGKLNFDPRQVDQLLMGNTVEENTALRGIASRMVDQQLTAEPAPGAVDVTLPERGRVVVFTRSLQVDGGAPLELELDIEKISGANKSVALLLLLGISALVALGWTMKSPAVA